MVITYNEQDNLARTLDSVCWADSIVLIDSGSTDDTLNIAKNYPNIRIVAREFTTFAEQCNYGLSNIDTDWVLSLDADYVFPEGAEIALRQCMNQADFAGYQAEFFYAIFGKVVRGSILPPRTVMYRREAARYEDDGHGHRVQIDGPVGALPFRVIHDDRKPFRRWLDSQTRYADQEADKILAVAPASLSWPDRIRRLYVVAPFLVFVLVYIVRGGFLSGFSGLFYALQRFYAELLLSMFLINRRLKS